MKIMQASNFSKEVKKESILHKFEERKKKVISIRDDEDDREVTNK